jgi:ATP adenylyltransferase
MASLKSHKNPSNSSLEDSAMMRALHPYWRFDYIMSKKQKDPFKNLRNADGKKRLIVARSKTAVLIMNEFPYAPGHLMALPYRAVRRLDKLTEIETLELQELIVLGQKLLEKVLKAEGVNIGLNYGGISGGSVLTHLHWHIVPRWRGDHSFMPIIGGTRLLPRSQESIWEAMVKEMGKKSKATKIKKS